MYILLNIMFIVSGIFGILSVDGNQTVLYINSGIVLSLGLTGFINWLRVL